MKLSDVINKKWPLVVDQGPNNIRYAAEMFIVPDGIVFLDVGWDQFTTHGIHKVIGEITGDSPWQVGEATVRIIDDTEEAMGDFMDWEYYLTTAEGQLATREAAQRYMDSTYQEN